MSKPAKRQKPDNLPAALCAKWDEAEATLDAIAEGRHLPISAAALMSPDPYDEPFKFGVAPPRPYKVGTIVYNWIASDLLNQRSAVVQDDGGSRIKIRHDGTQGLCFDVEIEVCAEHVRPTPWSEDNPPVPYSARFPARGRTWESYLTDEQREVLKRQSEELKRWEEEGDGKEEGEENVVGKEYEVYA